MKQVTIYTDGACSGNPGPGGWGAILQYGTAKKEISGGDPMTTNNKMELMGVISALQDRSLLGFQVRHRRHHQGLGEGLESTRLEESG